MTEKQSTTVFTYHDPGRTFDGTPYQAAAKAVTQAANVLKLYEKALKDANIQARNAFMQRQLDLVGKPNVDSYIESPEYKLILGFIAAASEMQKRLTALHKAVGYDPGNPPKE